MSSGETERTAEVTAGDLKKFMDGLFRPGAQGWDSELYLGTSKNKDCLATPPIAQRLELVDWSDIGTAKNLYDLSAFRLTRHLELGESGTYTASRYEVEETRGEDITYRIVIYGESEDDLPLVAVSGWVDGKQLHEPERPITTEDITKIHNGLTSPNLVSGEVAYKEIKRLRKERQTRVGRIFRALFGPPI